MEILFLLFLLVGAVVFLVVRSRSIDKSDEKDDLEGIKSVSNRVVSHPKLGRFDETRRIDNTVRPVPVPGEQVIQGSAYVVDGDTIVVKKTQIRLFGVDAPEMDHPYGKQAKWALVALCKRQSIRAEILETDAHGRTVARCFLPDGRDLSAEMVRQGLAIDWPKFSGGKYRSLEAPDARRKLWLADARQKGRMHVWRKFESRKNGEK